MQPCEYYLTWNRKATISAACTVVGFFLVLSFYYLSWQMCAINMLLPKWFILIMHYSKKVVKVSPEKSSSFCTNKSKPKYHQKVPLIPSCQKVSKVWLGTDKKGGRSICHNSSSFLYWENCGKVSPKKNFFYFLTHEKRWPKYHRKKQNTSRRSHPVWQNKILYWIINIGICKNQAGFPLPLNKMR